MAEPPEAVTRVLMAWRPAALPLPKRRASAAARSGLMNNQEQESWLRLQNTQSWPHVKRFCVYKARAAQLALLVSGCPRDPTIGSRGRCQWSKGKQHNSLDAGHLQAECNKNTHI